jgi:hypothetical protein
MNAGLDLARKELSGDHLDEEEKAVLNILDEIGDVRAIAASEGDGLAACDGEAASDPHRGRHVPEW